VVADVLDREALGVGPAGGDAGEDAGHVAATAGVHLAGDRHVLVGQPGHHRGDELGAELVDERAEEVLGHAGLGHRGDGVGLDVVLGALDGEHAGEADQAGLGGAVVGLAEVAEDAGGRRGVDDAAVVLLAHVPQAAWVT
jgi:hypothetical protein